MIVSQQTVTDLLGNFIQTSSTELNVSFIEQGNFIYRVVTATTTTISYTGQVSVEKHVVGIEPYAQRVSGVLIQAVFGLLAH